MALKRLDKPSLSEISPIHNAGLHYKNNFDFNYCTEYTMHQNQQHQQQQQAYADEFMNSQQDMLSEMNLMERLTYNRKCFHQFAEQIGNLRDTTVNVREMIVAKQCPSRFPDYKELLKIYEKDIQKMQITKTLKKNWNEDDTVILIWCVIKYQLHHQYESHKQFQESDWHYIANMVPGKDKESCRFKWLKMCKVNIQDEPWTKDENEILPQIVHIVEQKGKKDWVEVAARLFYETNQKVYRTPKQCREHFNNYHDPSIKKGTWTQDEDLELLKLASELGKKWSVIAKKLKGRTENAVKNRFHAIFRKHLEKGQEGADSFEEEGSNSSNNNSGIEGANNSSLKSNNPSQRNQNESIQLAIAGNERKLIHKLIRNIEENLKINSSEYYSSGDNNSVYSADSTANRASKTSAASAKAFRKQKHKMLLNFESSLSSDDDNNNNNNNNSKQHSPSPITQQKSIFSKVYQDQIKCKQDEEPMLDEEGKQGYNNKFHSNNGQFNNNRKQYDWPNKQQQQQQLFQSQSLPISNNRNPTQNQQSSAQQQTVVLGIQPSLPSNSKLGSQNFDFFNQQIVLGGSGQPQIQSKGEINEEYGGQSYLEAQQYGNTSASKWQNQQNNNSIAHGTGLPKIPSLEDLELLQDELKLKVMNYSELIVNEQDQYSHAVVNLTRSQIYLMPSSNTASVQNALLQQPSKATTSTTPVKSATTPVDQSSSHTTGLTFSKPCDASRTPKSNNIQGQSNVIVAQPQQSFINQTIQIQDAQQQPVTYQIAQQSQQTQQQQASMISSSVNNRSNVAPSQQSAALTVMTSPLLNQAPQQQYQQHYPQQQIQQQQQQTQQQQTHPTPSVFPTNQNQNSYNDFNIHQQQQQQQQTPQTPGLNSSLINFQGYSNQNAFQVLSQPIGGMKIEENPFFLMHRNSFDVQAQPFLSYSDPTSAAAAAAAAAYSHQNPFAAVAAVTATAATNQQQNNMNYIYSQATQQPQHGLQGSFALNTLNI